MMLHRPKHIELLDGVEVGPEVDDVTQIAFERRDGILSFVVVDDLSVHEIGASSYAGS